MKKNTIFDIFSIISAIYVCVISFLIYARIDEKGLMINKMFNSNMNFTSLNNSIESFFNKLFHINISENDSPVETNINYIELGNHYFRTEDQNIPALNDGTVIYKTVDKDKYVLSIDYKNYSAVYFLLNNTEVSYQDHFLKGDIIENTKNNFKSIFISKGKKSASKRSFPLIEISPLAFVFIFLSIFTNYIKYVLLLYLIAIIHELAHILVALFFKRKIRKIRVLPFGLYAIIDNIEELSFLKENLIYLAGPFSYFLSFLILILFKNNGMISNYSYLIAQNCNKTMALFNLIPYYPLDGSKILDTILGRLFLEKKSRIIRIAISIFFLLLISFFLWKEKQILLIVYLCSTLIFEIVLFKKKYFNFLIKRLFNKKPQKIKITEKEDIYRYYHTYFYKDKRMCEENKIIKKIIGSKDKN